MIDYTRDDVIEALEYLLSPVCTETQFDYCDEIRAAIAFLKEQEPITGDTSDGYHTFNELYHHRAVLFSVIVRDHKDLAWKARKHHDGTMFDGMFIVGIETPDGQATYHYDLDPYWDVFECKELECAPEWDGHTPAQAIERIGRLRSQEARVIELSEISPNIYVWVEDRQEHTVFPLRGGMFDPDGDDYFRFLENVELDYVYWPVGNYRYSWRVWDKCPTEEQRKAVKWND